MSFYFTPKKKCRKEEVSVDLIAHIKNLPGETEPFPPESVQIHRDSSSFSFFSSSSSTRGPGWGPGHHLPPPQGAPVPWAPCCQPHQHIPLPGSLLPGPGPPGRGVSTVPPAPRVQERVLVWGVGRGGQELVAGVARGPFRFAFGISVCSSLSLFPLYKMSCMVMGVGDTVTSGSGGRPALTAAGPGSVWTWCHR